MREKFVDTPLKQATLAVIGQANTIITKYQGMGLKLTLRQLYYQFVSRDLLENTQQNYKKLGDVLDKGRKAGLVDWAAIEDRTRNLEKPNEWSSPQAILDAVAHQYKQDLWATQPYYVETWIEKEALTGVIENVCEDNRVPYFACKGYVSQSEMYDAAQRFRKQRKPCIILHLGDHDPSGVHMSKDIEGRLLLLSRNADIEVRRLALTYDQIEEYSPPPNPAKDTDSRHDGYASMMVDEYGADPDPDDIPSWELDALEPTVISDLIQDELDTIIDRDEWNTAEAEEEEQKATLEAVAKRWDDVRAWLNDTKE